MEVIYVQNGGTNRFVIYLTNLHSIITVNFRNDSLSFDILAYASHSPTTHNRRFNVRRI